MTSADFTISDVLAWARTKPADERYDYVSNGNCALCIFLRETMRAVVPSVAPGQWVDAGVWHAYPRDPLEGALSNHDSFNGWTFGELVSRLEALLPAEPLSDTWTKADAYLTDIEAVPRLGLRRLPLSQGGAA